MTARRTVAIYADPLLSSTMTFVRAQALALNEFAPVFVGARRVAGLELPNDQVVVLHDGTRRLEKLREIPFKVLGYAPLFFRRVERFAPVLVHAHFGPSALTALPLSKWLGVPLISTFHGYDASVRATHLRRANFSAARYTVLKGALQRAGRLFIAVSERVRDLVIEQGYPEERTVVHYIGVDRAFFSPDERVQRENVVLFVASLTEQKGCEYLIRAMQDVERKVEDVQLVVIGDGPRRSELEALARSLRNVRFLGMQPSSTVREWLNRARVFCVPSIRAANGAEEGFGIVFAEAQAMGVPVVSFRTGGIPEAVEHGGTGMLAVEKDWQELARYIVELLETPGMWSQMSHAAQARVAARFDLDTQTRKLETLYERVLEDPP